MILAQAELGKPVIDSVYFPMQLTVLAYFRSTRPGFKPILNTPLTLQGDLHIMGCANQELAIQGGNMDDPITVPTGRDFTRLVAECEDIAAEIYQFYKLNFHDMTAIPSDIVLLEDRYYYMERKKKRFEQMRARMLASDGASFQNAPPPSFQNAAPPAAVAANEKRASTSEQSAPPPPAVNERTR